MRVSNSPFSPGFPLSAFQILYRSKRVFLKAGRVISLLPRSKARSLFRVRVIDERVVFSEPIPIGDRIRDLIEMKDGSIVMKLDSGPLAIVRPIKENTEK